MSDALTAPYEHATEMHDHWWWRPGWRVGRRFYSIFATFEDQSELHQLVDTWQQRLTDVPGLDAVPREWRHLTVQGVGFTDEIGTDALEAIESELSTRLSTFEPIRVSFGPLVVHTEALVLPAIPQDPLIALRSAIRGAIEVTLGPETLEGSPNGFRPHATVAYNSQDRQLPPKLKRAIESSVIPATITLRNIKLLEMNRDHKMYVWRKISAITIGDT